MKKLVDILNRENTTTKVNISAAGLNSRLEGTEERITALEERTITITQSEQREGSRLKKAQNHSVRDLWQYNQRPDVCVIRVPEEEKEEGAEKVLEEMMVANLSNLAED